MANQIYSLLNEKDSEKIEMLAKALASPLRLNIIRQLHQQPMTIIELAKLNKSPIQRQYFTLIYLLKQVF